MSIDGKKVLVTGAGGFIGSHLVEALARQGADVTAMLHYNSRSDLGDLVFLPRDQVAQLNRYFCRTRFVDGQIDAMNIFRVCHLTQRMEEAEL